MIEVNESFVGALLGVFSGGEPGLCDEYLLSVDPNNVDLIGRLLADQVKPFYEEYSCGSQAKIKESLRWLLNVGSSMQKSPSGEKIGSLFEQVFYSNMLALKLPDNPEQFYIQLWRVLFGGEDYSIADLKQYKRIDADDFVNNLR